MDSVTLNFIGDISTPYKQVEDCPRQPNAHGEHTIITIKPEYTAALDGIERVRFLQVLYWMNQADRTALKRIPPSRPDLGELGVFSIRSPMRPNPIAISVVELFEVNGNCLITSPMDCLNHTPLVDLKNYIDQKPTPIATDKRHTTPCITTK